MAISYNTLGLQTYRQPTYDTNMSYIGAPMPKAYKPYPLYGIGTGRASGTGEVGTTVSIEDAGGDEPGAGYDTLGISADIPSGSLLGKVTDYAAETLNDYFGFPEEINQLTGTMRVTGIPDILAAMIPMHMSALMSLGSAVSQENLESIFGQQQAGKPGYGVGTLDNAILGVSPNAISTAFGMSPTDAGVLSGTIPDAPPGISQSAYEAAIMDALQNVQSIPGRPAVSGIGPPSAATIGDITDAVNLDVFGTVQGQDMGLPGGYLTSSSPNPLGPDFADVNTPVRTLDALGRPLGYVTLGSSPPDGDLGFGGFSSAEVGSQSGFGVTGALGPEDIAETTTGSVPGNRGQPPGIGLDFGNPDSGHTGGSAADGSEADTGGGYGGLGHAVGGRVGMQTGGTAVTEGFVNKDPRTVSDSQGIADNRFTSVPQGSFVMNQPANEMYKDDLDVVLGDAEKRAGSDQNNGNMVDVALSDGERLIRPEVVNFVEKKYGGGFLDNINNTGKPEVQRRQVKYGAKIGAADGGFLADQGMEVKDVGEDVPMEDYQPISEELRAKLTKFAAKKPKRGDIRDFIKSLPPEEKLTVLFLTETQSTTDPIESMEAIGEVVNNRIKSDYYDFKGIKTLDDALLKQTKRGAFQFSGLEPSTFFERAKEVKGGTASKGLAKAYAAAQNVLDPETEGANRLDPNTLFYTRKDAPSQWMRESKDLEFSTELGGHEFYRTFASREFP